ncbi:MAG: DNA mismatch repair protein MutS [Firmicutes bacterium]|nr:DNA mismatch repair protein MutS [Bacillota bacterium]
MLSPMMKQYMRLKEEHPDCLIFFRLGDFYEMFFDDAKLASGVLDLTLTGRDCGLPERAPMCGVPHTAVDPYIAKLIENGYKVAVCEQLSDPAESKGLVDRGVTRIYTAGTLTDPDMLPEDGNNYLAALYSDGKIIGMAWGDISTGEMNIEDFNDIQSLKNRLAMVRPSEIICNDKASGLDFGRDNAYTRRMNLTVMDGADGASASVAAASALVSYFHSTQLTKVSHMRPAEYDGGQYMQLDAAARKHLELTETRDGKKAGSIFWLLNKTQTKPGARMLRKWIEQPLYDAGRINARLNAVEELFNDAVIRAKLKELLRGLSDIERITSKIALDTVMPGELAALKNTLVRMPGVRCALGSLTTPFFTDIHSRFDINSETLEILESAIADEPPVKISDGGYIKAGYNPELDGLRAVMRDGKGWLAALEAAEREQTGIKNLKISYNKVFGYYIEVSKSQIQAVPYRYIRKQTIATGERYITEELKNFEEKIEHSYEKSAKLEAALYREIKLKLSVYVERLQALASDVAAADTILSFALASVENGYNKPSISGKDALVIIEGRHPIVEMLNRKEQFVPNDTGLMGADSRVMVITGPNMSGKSTYMRQVALITLMAHIGCFVPARAAEIPLTDKIFTRIGAGDDLAAGNSTFMVEMLEVAGIVKNAGRDSLIILDEIGRGTSTFDGLSIAWAVMEYICEHIGGRALFATHYYELTDLEGHLPGIKNYRVTAREINNNVVFLRKVVRGGANKSFGIQVAKLAGIPDRIIDSARRILSIIEKNDINRAGLVLSGGAAQLDMFGGQTEKTGVANEIINILTETDLEKLTPLQAFETLVNLVGRAREHNG